MYVLPYLFGAVMPYKGLIQDYSYHTSTSFAVTRQTKNFGHSGAVTGIQLLY